MTEVSSRIPALQNGKVIVPVTAGLCLFLLTIILKNVLQVPAERLSSEIVLYIILYSAFVLAFPFMGETEPAEPVSPPLTMLWVSVIVMVTLAFIWIYSI